jgi:hypothetical protein
MKTKLILLMQIILSFFLFAQDTTSNYYPLKVGNEWTYRLEGNNTQVVKIIDSLDQYGAFQVRTVAKYGSMLPMTTEELIEPRGNIVLNIAFRGGLGSGEWRFYSGNTILQFPLRKNGNWKGEKEGTYNKYQVISFEDVETSAGKFANVCKILLTITYRNTTTNKIEPFAKMYQYYAPDVGLVKEEIIKKDKTISMYRELIGYNIANSK